MNFIFRKLKRWLFRQRVRKDASVFAFDFSEWQQRLDIHDDALPGFLGFTKRQIEEFRYDTPAAIIIACKTIETSYCKALQHLHHDIVTDGGECYIKARRPALYVAKSAFHGYATSYSYQTTPIYDKNELKNLLNELYRLSEPYNPPASQGD